MLPSCSSSGERQAEGKSSSAFTDRAPSIPKLPGCHFTPPSAQCQGWEGRICPAPGTGEGEARKQLLLPGHCTMAFLVLGKH